MLYSEAQELYAALEFTLPRNEELKCQDAEEKYFKLSEVGYLIEGFDTSMAIESALDTIKNTFKTIQKAFHTVITKFEVFVRSFIRKHRQKKSRRLINDLYGVTILISKEEVDRLEKVFDNLDLEGFNGNYFTDKSDARFAEDDMCKIPVQAIAHYLQKLFQNAQDLDEALMNIISGKAYPAGEFMEKYKLDEKDYPKWLRFRVKKTTEAIKEVISILNTAQANKMALDKISKMKGEPKVTKVSSEK